MIGELVDTFYNRGRQDPLLAPVSAPTDAGPYGAVDKAATLHRWLALLQQTTANVCPPPAASIFLENARRIADSFEMAMATQRGRIAGPRHLRRS
jgi:hemoglobin